MSSTKRSTVGRSSSSAPAASPASRRATAAPSRVSSPKRALRRVRPRPSKRGVRLLGQLELAPADEEPRAVVVEAPPRPLGRVVRIEQRLALVDQAPRARPVPRLDGHVRQALDVVGLQLPQPVSRHQLDRPGLTVDHLGDGHEQEVRQRPEVVRLCGAEIVVMLDGQAHRLAEQRSARRRVAAPQSDRALRGEEADPVEGLVGRRGGRHEGQALFGGPLRRGDAASRTRGRARRS